MGRKAEAKEIDEKELEKNLQVLKKFYFTYWRSPKESEFKICGGNVEVAKMEAYGRYSDFLKLHGFAPANTNETIGVFNTDNKIEFMGIRKDIADAYDLSEYKITELLRNQRTFDNGLSLRQIPFIGIREFYDQYKFAI